jgi:allophanate hydrolase
MSESQQTVGSIDQLREAYTAGTRTPETVVEQHLDLVAEGPDEIWISRPEPERIRERAAALEESVAATAVDWETYPLYGVPFAVKDNIDHAESITTAGCPEYGYVADSHATVVRRLLDAGAIFVGKTNLDQFATGLVGTRSPYGSCPNAIDPDYISGGSSSGSGVSVALGQVTFALGTDTAGSGRVPAALNGVIGMKPSRGLLSNTGVVPACKSLDCVAIFANTCMDALRVERIAAGFDPADEYSRSVADDLSLVPDTVPTDTVIGVPASAQLEFFGDDTANNLFIETVNWVGEQFTTTRIDIEPFIEAGRLLYQGPWVAERLAAVQEFLSDHPDAMLQTTQEIITRGRNYSAVDTFTAEYKLRRLARDATEQLAGVTAIMTPTTGTTYTQDEVDDNPVDLNSNLGYYTNFMNLLDLSAIALPAGRYQSGLPLGVTLFADTFEDAILASIGEAYCRERSVAVGAASTPYHQFLTE